MVEGLSIQQTTTQTTKMTPLPSATRCKLNKHKHKLLSCFRSTVILCDPFCFRFALSLSLSRCFRSTPFAFVSLLLLSFGLASISSHSGCFRSIVFGFDFVSLWMLSFHRFWLRFGLALLSSRSRCFRSTPFASSFALVTFILLWLLSFCAGCFRSTLFALDLTSVALAGPPPGAGGGGAARAPVAQHVALLFCSDWLSLGPLQELAVAARHEPLWRNMWHFCSDWLGLGPLQELAVAARHEPLWRNMWHFCSVLIGLA
jgi:hypothetical protein